MAFVEPSRGIRVYRAPRNRFRWVEEFVGGGVVWYVAYDYPFSRSPALGSLEEALEWLAA